MNLTNDNLELAENKILLLHFINKLDFPINRMQITKVMLENRFMNYFFLQQYIEELKNDDLLNAQREKNTDYYTITPKGKEMLDYFINIIPAGIKSRIDNTIREIRSSIRNESNIDANYYAETEDQFIINCKISEDTFSLIDFSLAAGSKENARTMCKNFKEHSSEIYMEIMDVLMKERD